MKKKNDISIVSLTQKKINMDIKSKWTNIKLKLEMLKSL